MTGGECATLSYMYHMPHCHAADFYLSGVEARGMAWAGGGTLSAPPAYLCTWVMLQPLDFLPLLLPLAVRISTPQPTHPLVPTAAGRGGGAGAERAGGAAQPIGYPGDCATPEVRARAVPAGRLLRRGQETAQ